MSREKITPGRMAFVHLSAHDTAEFLDRFDPGISVAIELGPEITVIAGEAGAIASALASLEASGIRSRLSRMTFAFHSPLVLSLEQSFLGPLQQVNAESGFLPIYSSVTGTRHSGTRFDHEYWWRVVHQRALFRSTLNAVLADGYRRFVEVGPHPILLHALRDTAQESGMEIVALAPMKRNCDDAAELERFLQLSALPRNL